MKTLTGFCVMLAFLAMPLAFYVQPSEPQFIGYQAEFIGQDVAEVGELVRFVAEGDAIEWKCLPETQDCESYGEKNENFVISFRKPGNYTVIAAIYTEGKLEIYTQTVSVEASYVPDPPTPVEPPVISIDDDLVSKVSGWARKYQIKSEVCIALATNFELVAVQIESGNLRTPGEIISATANLNSDLKLDENLMAELQAYLTSQSDAGNLKTPDQHLVVWNSIAKGLKNAAL